MRTAFATLLLLLLGAAPAAAAEIRLEVGPRAGVELGESHRVAGVLTDDAGDPLPDQVVTLEVRPWPYDKPYRELDTGTTGPEGEYRFDPTFRRNNRIRVRAAGASEKGLAAVFPRARLSYRTVGRNRVRLIHTLTGPPALTISGRTRFYIGRARAKAARYVAITPARRRRAGRFVARKTVRIPASFRGRFSYAACFRASTSSGMGDPRKGCPRRRFRF